MEGLIVNVINILPLWGKNEALRLDKDAGKR
jgi:hypothetical protein